MENSKENDYKITINYSNGKESWNNFVNNIVSFMIDNNTIEELLKHGDICENSKSTS